jgi:hypothetical protein
MVKAKKKLVDDELRKLEELQEESDDFGEIPPANITTYSELRSCSDLYRMYKNNQLDIDPDFQRERGIWNDSDQTRFIDSLVKKMPVSNMCFSLDTETEQRRVIDGLQRISTIIRFFEAGAGEAEWVLANLPEVDQKIAGKSVSDLRNTAANHYARVENMTIPVTVVQCDYTNRQHLEYMFTIFRRLNTGGLKLNNQEIRNGIYSGVFNDLLHEIAKNKKYKEIFALTRSKGVRFAYEELVLRFFALMDYKRYTGKLEHFLSTYMFNNRNPKDNFIIDHRFLFERVALLIMDKIQPERVTLSKALFEALLVGVGRNIDRLEKETQKTVAEKYSSLIADPLFSPDSLKEGLAGKDRVQKRLGRADEIFRGHGNH